MIFSLFEININWRSTSWIEICVLTIGHYDFALFSIEFDKKEMVHFDIFGIRELIKKRKNKIGGI